MLLYNIGLEAYALTLSRDGYLRVWSCSKSQCIAVNNLMSDIDVKHLVPGGKLIIAV